MRIIQLLFLATLLILPRGAAAADGGATRVRAVLVIASNQKGEADPRLASYEPTLRSMLRFESYRFVSEGSTSIASSSGKAAINLGRGHSLELDAPGGRGGNVRLQLNWQEGGRSLMNTGLSLQPGKPAVLGGPSTGKAGEVWAVIVIAG
jgi:hypothetical protein